MSELLHKSGVNMVEQYDSSAGYYGGNKMERESTLTLNQQILKSNNTHSLDINVRHVPTMTEAQKQVMNDVIQRCQSEYKDWGFKDPRSCITYPLWKQVLPKHKVIVVYRHPVQVMNHYRKKTRWGRTKGYFGWVAHNDNICKFIENNDNDILVINYLDLMSDMDIVKKLESFIERPIIDARKSSRYTNKSIRSQYFNLLNLVNGNKATKIYRKLELMKI